MESLPRLEPVPGQHIDLTRKASASGVIYIKSGRFKKRYTGNKYSEVDINGNLWLRSNDLKKHIRQPDNKPKRQKKSPTVETVGGANLFNVEQMQISEILSTPQTQDGKDIAELSTIKAQREYGLKKSLIRQRLIGFINAQKGKKELYFWTVTFPMGTPDDVAYRIYNHWLTTLRKHKMLKNYLWVAERQGEKSKVGNTTLHFHIAIPHRMDVYRANRNMQGILKQYSKRGEIPFSVYQCNRYNGVDIAKHRTTRRVTNFAIKKGQQALTAYLTKYIAKNDEKFSHLAWHNSRGFSALFLAVTFSKQEFSKNGLWLHLDFRRQIETEWCIIVPWFGDPPKILMRHLADINNYCREINSSDHQPVVIEAIGYYSETKQSNNMWNKQNSFKMPVNPAEQLAAAMEIQMEKAFLRYIGKCDYSKEFCSAVRLGVIDRIKYIGMEKEFDALLKLLDKEENDPGFFYTYYLYLYWVVDLLNQITNI